MCEGEKEVVEKIDKGIFYITWLLLVSVFITVISPLRAGEIFKCDNTPYLVIDEPSKLQRLNSDLSVETLDTLDYTINAIGFNLNDGYIYSQYYSKGDDSLIGHIIQLDAEGNLVDKGKPQDTPNSKPKTTSGTMDNDGYYYSPAETDNGESKYILRLYIGSNPDDLSTQTWEEYRYVDENGTDTSIPHNLHDLAYDDKNQAFFGIEDYYLYKVYDLRSENGRNVATVKKIKTVGDPLPFNEGGAWSAAGGVMYFYDNSTSSDSNALYRVTQLDDDTAQVEKLGAVASASAFDAASCRAPRLNKRANVDTKKLSPGDTFTYTFTIYNPKGADIEVDFYDHAPAYASFDSTSLSPDAPGNSTVETNSSEEFNITSITVPSYGSIEFNITTIVDSDISESVAIENSAYIIFGAYNFASADPSSDKDGPTVVNVVPTVSMNSQEGVEGSSLIFDVNLDILSTTDIEMKAFLESGMATIGEDIINSIAVSTDGGATWHAFDLNQSFTFPANQLSIQVKVDSNVDNILETQENFTLTLEVVSDNTINDEIVAEGMIYNDHDHDGIADKDDPDSDNDGILDNDEYYCSAPDIANVISYTESDTIYDEDDGFYMDQIYMFTWEGDAFDTLEVGDSKTFLLNDGTEVTATLVALDTTYNDFGPESAAHELGDHLYRTDSGADRLRPTKSGINYTMEFEFKATKNGHDFPLHLIGADAEGTGSREWMQFTTNGTGWEWFENSINGAASYTLADENRVITYNDTVDKLSLFLTRDATNIRVASVTKSSGKEGFSLGMRIVCDKDNDSIPDYLDLDSDNDGIADYDEVGVGAPSGSDSDGDGLDDRYDGNQGGVTGTVIDSDGDGIADFRDIDSDNDGLTDLFESGQESSLDSNGDGILDSLIDLDQDGLMESVDTDDNKTSAPAAIVTLVDRDGDGLVNYRDIDSDGDGIPDVIEAQTTAGYVAPSGIDADRDGLDDMFDVESNNSSAFVLSPVDTDGDQIPDYLDRDSDNDGQSDANEAWDVNNSGTADRVPTNSDDDHDGLDDGYDNNTSFVDPTNATTPLSYPNNNGGGNERDWRENVAPTAIDDNVSVLEEGTVSGNVLVGDDNSSDFDSDGDAIYLNSVMIEDTNYTIAQGESETITIEDVGELVIFSDGNYTFTPVENFYGDVPVITYSITDEIGGSDVAELRIYVKPVNDAPVAKDDNATTQEDTAVVIDVVGNDSDVDGSIDTTTVDLDPTTDGVQNSIVTTEGNWSVDSDGKVTFTPAENYNGTATLPYVVSDNNATFSNEATISIVVEAVNDAPVAKDDNATTQEDTAVVIDVVGNDSDVDGSIDTTTVDLDPTTDGVQNSIVTTEGNWSVDSDGKVTFTPAENYNGTATLPYVVSDNNATFSNEATISVVVEAVNDAPVAKDDNATTQEDTAVVIDVVGNDSDVDGSIDTTTVDLDPTTDGVQNSIVTTEGNWSVDSDGKVTFTPAENYNGTATLPYVVSDNNATFSNEATISVVVEAVNDAPYVVEDIELIQSNDDENISLDLSLYFNDEDNNRSDLNFSAQGLPEGLSIDSETGMITGVIDRSASQEVVSGDYNITITVTDPDGGFVTTSFLWHVDNPLPVLYDDNVTVDEDSNVSFNLFENDSDPDGDLLSVIAVGVDVDKDGNSDFNLTLNEENLLVNDENVTVGTIVIDENGTVIFVPAPNYNGDVPSMIVTVTDADGGVDTSTLTFSVNAMNDQIVAKDDLVTNIPVGESIRIDVLANDDDVDGRDDMNISTLRFTSDLATDSNGDSYNDRLEVASEGIWQIENGEVIFTPNSGFTGDPAPVAYQLEDQAGLASNEAWVRLDYVQVLQSDRVIDIIAGSDVEIDILSNDNDVNVSTLRLVASEANDTDGNSFADRLEVKGEGVWYIEEGKLHFEPEDGFTGDPIPIEYQVNDAYGNVLDAVSVTIDYTQLLRDDNVTAMGGESVTVNIVENDDEINVSTVSLDAKSVDGTGEDSDGDGDIDTVIVDGEGRWYVDNKGILTFTPEYTYDFEPKPITYSAKDKSGHVTGSATVSVIYTVLPDTILPPQELPVSRVDEILVPIVIDTEKYGQVQSIVLDEPEHGSAFIDEGDPDDPTDDVIVYKPEADYRGVDSFSYTVIYESGANVSQEVICEVCVTSQQSDSVRALDMKSMMLWILLFAMTTLYYVRRQEEFTA